MDTAAEGHVVFLRLRDGEDLFTSLRQGATRHGVACAIVLAGIGMLRKVEVGYFQGGGAYARRRFEEPRELVSLQGSFVADGDPPLHLHASLAGPDYQVIGGHVFGAEVAVLTEVTMRRLDVVRLGRRFNPATGLNETAVL